ncbi:ISAs1 family transposase [Amycolatopsis sp. RTGN1]|uniref:ISAs1 family transposase n=1 Tax=Amycolatopsis ponsaeliensis TaxID=2992142 RepID=UPI00254CF14D|nr:ISAs1 family transposase [Amycolatopsis sp. RTGN1]
MSARRMSVPVVPVVVPVAQVCTGLLQSFAQVSDGRSDQGRDHPVAAVLALAAAATVAGMGGYTAITGWVAEVPAEIRHNLYRRSGAAPAAAPSKATLWRVVTGADPQAFDAAVGTWLTRGLSAMLKAAEHVPATGKAPLMMQIRLDGKTSRGATDAEGNQMHLLAVLIGQPGKTTVVAAQTEVGAKTNEVPKAVDVLDQIDLTNTVSTADALHTVKATADYIHRRDGFFLLPVKENRAALYAACDALPWASTPIAHKHTERGHGRITRRTIRVLPAPEDLPFPHVKQVYLIERYVTDTTGQSPSAAAALGVTNLTDTLAGPADLATYVQDHWGVESLHWLRDTCYREDNSHAHTRSGPRILASLRNLAIGALRLAGRHDITEATRWANRYMYRPFTILGLTF